ncbi:MAG: endonuclease [Bacteroidales bacterium]
MKKLNALFFVFLLALSSFGAIPDGYYNTATGTGATLKTNLYNIIKGHTSISYDALWTAFQSTDVKPDGKVWDMYSNCTFTFGTNQCGNYSSECDCYNREHSLPASWFNDATPMYTDLFHLVPTDGKVNGMRGNVPFGEVGSPTYTSGNGCKLGNCSYTGYTGIVFEPIDEYKGDFARNYFYMVTRYENVISSWHSNDANAEAVFQANTFPVFETWFVNMLGEWNSADPVSQKEIDRNNAIYAIQHNRNPYIDHPEYVYSVWGVGVLGQLTATPASFTGFNYNEGFGPSASQSYSLGGTALSPASGSILVTGSTNFEVSSNNTSFSSSVSINYSAGALSATTIYVRLKSGLAPGSYSNNLISNSGGGATPVTVSCSGSVTALSPEPTNYPANFSAHNILLQWTDATGPAIPTGYLIRMSSTSFAAIPDPVDGTPVPDGPVDKNIPYNTQQAWFTNLSPGTTYYFKLYAYIGSGVSINYKTDGLVPQMQQNTGL